MRVASTSTERISIEEDLEVVSTSSPKVDIPQITETTPKAAVEEPITTTYALNTTANGENVKSEKMEKSAQSIKTILIGL